MFDEKGTKDSGRLSFETKSTAVNASMKFGAIMEHDKTDYDKVCQNTTKHSY